MSTVRITWIDSVTPGVTGHKIYRDDVELADVGLLVQTYDDTTAAENTTYKYEVQAYTATGESTDETLGVNMNNITTAVGVSVPAADLYDDTPNWNGTNYDPIVLGSAGVNSPLGTFSIQYDTSLLTGSNSYWFGLQKDGGSYVAVTIGGGTITNYYMRRRVGYGSTISSTTENHDHSQLTTMAIVWRGTTQELWIGGVQVLALTGLDAIPVDEFTQFLFTVMNGTADPWLQTIHNVKLWSTELTSEELELLTT